MADLHPQGDPEVAARLLEELTRTNNRLERLEAVLCERSLLPSIQEEPAHQDAGAAPEPEAGAAVVAPAPSPVAEVNSGGVEEAESHFRRGVTLCQAGDFEGAVAAWRDVLRLQPDNAYALANTGIVFTEQGKWNDAREAFMRVLEIQPDNAEAHYGLGMADAQLGNYAGAVAAWENTLRLQPENSDAHYNLALIRQRMAVGNSKAPPVAAAATEAPPDMAVVAAPAAPARPGANGAAGSATAASRSMPDDTALGADTALDANGEDAADDDEERAEDASGLEATPRSAASQRQWKRVQGSGVNAGGGAMKRGAGRVSMPAGRSPSRIPVGGIALAGLLLVGAAMANNYRLANERAAHERPYGLAGTPAPGVTRMPGAADVNQRPAASAGTSPGVSKPPSQPGANASARPGSSAAHPGGSAAELPAPTVHPATMLAVGAGAPPAAGPPRAGLMHIRLGRGVAGMFQYWFVSRGDHSGPIRRLPAANRAGLITLFLPAGYNHSGAQLRVLNITQGKVARIPVSDVSRASVARSVNAGPNLLQNADFSRGANGWNMEMTAPARGAMRIDDALAAAPGVAGRAVHFDVSAVASQAWNVQCYQSGVNLKDKDPYVLAFWAKSDRARPFHVDIILDKADWHPVGGASTVRLGPKWDKYILRFNANRSEPSHTRLSFILGEALGPVDMCGISLRRSEGSDRKTIVQPGAVITIGARDFN